MCPETDLFMVKATVLNEVQTADLGEHVLKATSSTPGQTEVSFTVWEGDGARTGVWEATPGTFTSTREGFNEVCVILSGAATISDENGTFDIGPGSLFVTPAGWRGSWTVHETLRKVGFVQNL
jgi:uncharacterized cupin superfamily protein